MALTYMEAIAELNDPGNVAKYSTTEGLLDRIRRTGVSTLETAAGATTMLYSGRCGSMWDGRRNGKTIDSCSVSVPCREFAGPTALN